MEINNGNQHTRRNKEEIVKERHSARDNSGNEGKAPYVVKIKIEQELNQIHNSELLRKQYVRKTLER